MTGVIIIFLSGLSTYLALTTWKHKIKALTLVHFFVVAKKVPFPTDWEYNESQRFVVTDMFKKGKYS